MQNMATTPDVPLAGPGPVGSEVKSLASLVKKSFSSSGLGAPLIIPRGYGCVILTGIGSVVLLKWKSMKVSEARRDFTVPNPITHSDSCMSFNCAYRAMQSTLEIYPQFLFLLLTGGLELPYLSTVGGFIWIVGRYAYAKGYYSGDPRKRANGGFYIIGQFLLLIGAIKFALKRMVL